MLLKLSQKHQNLNEINDSKHNFQFFRYEEVGQISLSLIIYEF